MAFSLLYKPPPLQPRGQKQFRPKYKDHLPCPIILAFIEMCTEGHYCIFTQLPNGCLTFIHGQGVYCQYMDTFSLSVSKPNLRRGF